jgi:hypothetical protein
LFENVFTRSRLLAGLLFLLSVGQEKEKGDKADHENSRQNVAETLARGQKFLKSIHGFLLT